VQFGGSNSERFLRSHSPCRSVILHLEASLSTFTYFEVVGEIKTWLKVEPKKNDTDSSILRAE
jgi:hypothetical protein